MEGRTTLRDRPPPLDRPAAPTRSSCSNEGAVAARGSHAELLERSPQYRTIYETQLAARRTRPAALAGGGGRRELAAARAD